ncbi:uncharacterized protein MYCFIDRAFT_42291 [Pseudocercospora fijiensis CIRAD86]|uniref:Malate/L-lactate dehydrogenase n=1 Tax=Pseudocercospora fijiensis (strain CIRAD86) TaxID=383855 RepID=M2ZDU7_PSEFD|nr:uncharacterized protein MYCFIDRAFT_42291 [Pseudocercospora fijiensis CIRAD86]EME77259.1 hypothetical protein MYCFIDRAFT_42291 [Pseudocercospora fijiensis CIRAD86]
MEHVQPADAITFAESLLISHGLSEEHAQTIAQCLVAADLRGVDTHGINRLPSYIAKIKKGAIDVKAEPELKQITPAVAQVDAKNAFGFVGAKMGMAKAIEMATVFGIGMVSIKHSNHFGMSAWLVQQAIDANMLALVFTNSSPALPPWGSKSKILGVSPIACGAPGADHPFILDMAPSNAARGKVYKALRRNEKIPKDWALNAAGEPTDDPKEALEGVMLPMGGPKGSGLAIMMDVFSGVLSGSAFAGCVKGPYDPSSDPADVGHFLMAIKPDLFMTKEEFVERAEFLYQKVTTSEKAAGVDRIYFPGEIEQLTEEKRKKEGIPYAEGEIQTLNAEASAVGVPGLKVSK